MSKQTQMSQTWLCVGIVVFTAFMLSVMFLGKLFYDGPAAVPTIDEQDLVKVKLLGELARSEINEAEKLARSGEHLKAAFLLARAASIEKSVNPGSDTGPTSLERVALKQFKLADKGEVYEGLLQLEYPRWNRSDAKGNLGANRE